MKKIGLLLMVVLMATSSSAWASPQNDVANMKQELEVLNARIAQLEAQQSEQAVQQRNAELLREMLAQLSSNSKNAAQDTGRTSGYNNGFFVKTVDDQFLMQVNGQMQFRYNFLYADNGNNVLNKEGYLGADKGGEDDSGNSVDPSVGAFELSRPRIKLSGYAWKDLHYVILFGFADSDNNIGLLKEFYAYYSFMPELGAKAGIFKMPFNREFNTESTKLMMVDRSLADTVFNAGRSTGVELFGDITMVDNSKLFYRAGVFNGLRDLYSTPYGNNDNNPALAARLALPLLGADKSDFADESDLSGHDNPILQLGIGGVYAHANNEGNFAGGNDQNYIVLVRGGDNLSNSITMSGETYMATADLAFKYQGLSVILDGYWQHNNVDSRYCTFSNQFGSYRDSFGVNGYQYDNSGFTAQSGYFIVPKKFELVARVSGVYTDNVQGSHEYTGGWNWYFLGQNLKLSMDVSYIDHLPITNAQTEYYGVQNNALMLIRTQLQVLF